MKRHRRDGRPSGRLAVGDKPHHSRFAVSSVTVLSREPIPPPGCSGLSPLYHFPSGSNRPCPRGAGSHDCAAVARSVATRRQIFSLAAKILSGQRVRVWTLGMWRLWLTRNGRAWDAPDPSLVVTDLLPLSYTSV